MKRNKTGQDFIAEMKARQRNIVFPDTVVNGRRVDELFWKGSPDATLIQRIGMGLFGLFIVAGGLVFLSYGKGDRSILAIAVSWFFILIGARLLRNAFRTRQTRDN